MPHCLYLIASGNDAGLTSVALGLVRALDNRGVRVAFFKPIGQQPPQNSELEHSTHFVRETSSLKPARPIPLAEAERLLATGRSDELFEQVMRNFHASSGDADVVIVEGLVDSLESAGEEALNQKLASTLSAELILVAAQGKTPREELEARIAHTASRYGGFGDRHVVGTLLNRVPTQAGAPPPANPLTRAEFNVIGVIPENPELAACRTIDVARELGAEVLHAGEIELRRVRKISLLARSVPHLLDTLSAGSLLVTPGDRLDVILLVALAAANKVPLAGLILTGDSEVPPRIRELCRPGLESGLPVLAVHSNSFETATALSRMRTEIPIDDLYRARRSMDFIAEHVNVDWIARRSSVPVEARLSPAAFCYRLTELASRANRRIVLPEGDEPRTVRAAAICAARGIARPVLLGDPAEVQRVASAQEIQLGPGIEIIDPRSVRANYVAPLVERRKHKGLTPPAASELLEDNVWLGTMMLELGEVDGLVSGAVHSTANTIRPALSIVKTKPSVKVVSSVFFMCLPEQVVVYGDCAVIPDPDAETLADIATQSADSAAAFGISPRVALISYSTGESGSGSDVDKVREATRLARALRPNMPIDGPLQYDAAAIPDVARTKAKDSPVAGRATVFIFPDLNTGNTTYKAVQRSASVISIGPMLQGLRRPVNDLSRGALVEDIVYTIAITAIQAGER